jgi:hypothetical protein
MKYKLVLYYITAIVIVFSLLFSGCVSVPPKTTPMPTVIPTQTASSQSVVPVINVTSYPASSDVDTDFGIDWDVTGGTPGIISKTAIIWDYKRGSAKISDYSNISAVQTGKTPEQFNDTLNVPDNSTVYFRAYAVVDGIEIYSQEYQTVIIPSAVSGEP